MLRTTQNRHNRIHYVSFIEQLQPRKMQKLGIDHLDPVLYILESAENLDAIGEIPEDNPTELHSMALWQACKNGDVSMVVRMIAAGANVHWRGDLALIQAVKSNRLTVVNILVANGANVRASQDVALRLAVIRNNIDMARLLLTFGANASALNDFPLRRAMDLQNREMVTLLAEHGAGPSDWLVDEDSLTCEMIYNTIYQHWYLFY